jgi:PleD family two-component response regulator
MPISLHLVEKAETPAKSRKRPSHPPSAKEKEAFASEATPESNPPVPVGKNRKILIVDDNAVVLKAFELKLKSDGFVVTTSANSASVASTVEQTQSDLVVLDVNFPSSSGC